MKKTDKLIIALLLCAAVFCAVKFVPNKQQVVVRFLENLVKISVREGQTAFVQEHLSVLRLLRHEMGNPLVSSQGEEEPVRDLSQTDADVEALRQKALKKSKP